MLSDMPEENVFPIHNPFFSAYLLALGTILEMDISCRSNANSISHLKVRGST